MDPNFWLCEPTNICLQNPMILTENIKKIYTFKTIVNNQNQCNTIDINKQCCLRLYVYLDIPNPTTDT